MTRGRQRSGHDSLPVSSAQEAKVTTTTNTSTVTATPIPTTILTQQSPVSTSTTPLVLQSNFRLAVPHPSLTNPYNIIFPPDLTSVSCRSLPLFYTVTSQGVTEYSQGFPPTFLTLSEFTRFRQIYATLLTFPLFRSALLLRTFHCLRVYMRSRRMQRIRKIVGEKLLRGGFGGVGSGAGSALEKCWGLCLQIMDIDVGMLTEGDENYHNLLHKSSSAEFLADTYTAMSSSTNSSRTNTFSPEEFEAEMVRRRVVKFVEIERLYGKLCNTLSNWCKECLVSERLVEYVGNLGESISDDDDDYNDSYTNRRSNYAFSTSNQNANQPMPWAVAARQRSLCTQFLRLFSLVQLMLNSAFRTIFCNHTESLLQMLLPGARDELKLGSDLAYMAYNFVDDDLESTWREDFRRAFDSSKDGAEEGIRDVNTDMSGLEAVASVDDATNLAKPLLKKIFTSLATRHNALHQATRQQDPNYINVDLINLSKEKIKKSMQDNVKLNQITNDIIGANEFILGMKDFLAANANIRTFFHFQCEIDFDHGRVFPLPDAEDFIDVINRTNLSVLYSLANFRPIDTHISLVPYIRMAGGERLGGSEVDLEDPNNKSAYIDPPSSDNGDSFIWNPDDDGESKRFEIDWVKTILENDDLYITKARNLVKAATIAFESVEVFLRKHACLLVKHEKSMAWDIEESVCKKLQSQGENGSKDGNGIYIRDNSLDEDIGPESPASLTASASASHLLENDELSQLNNLQWLDDIVTYHLNHECQIRSLPDRELCGIIFLNNSQLTKALLPGPMRCLDHLRVTLPPFFRKYANGVLEKLSHANRDMSSVCRTVAEYVSQLESVKQVEDLFDVVEKEVVKINNFYDFLKSHGFLRTTMPDNTSSSTFSDEDMLSQAINQEMAQVAATKRTCRQTTDSQMAKFRNLQKDVDRVEIIRETNFISDALNQPFLNSKETPPVDALSQLSLLQKKMSSLREKITDFKWAQKIINENCRDRGLVDADQLRELRLTQFREADRVENSLIDYMTLFKSLLTVNAVRNKICATAIDDFDRERDVMSIISPVSDQLALIEPRFQNDVVARIKIIIQRNNLIADLIYLLKHEDLIGSYRSEVERLFPNCKVRSRIGNFGSYASGSLLTPSIYCAFI